MSKAPVNQSVNVASKSTPGKIINKVEMQSHSKTVKSKSEEAVKIPLCKSLKYAQSSKFYANWVLNEILKTVYTLHTLFLYLTIHNLRVVQNTIVRQKSGIFEQ